MPQDSRPDRCRASTSVAVARINGSARVSSWVMWPATGLMVAGGLTALFLKWNVIARTFRNLSARAAEGTDFPLRWVVVGAAVSSVALAVVQRISLGFPVWLTAVSLLLSFPLMLVGIGFILMLLMGGVYLQLLKLSTQIMR